MKSKKYKVIHSVQIEKEIEAANPRDALEKTASQLPTNAKRIRASVFGAQGDPSATAAGVIDYTGDDIEVNERRAAIFVGEKEDDFKIVFRNENGIVGELNVTGSKQALEKIMPQISSLYRDGTISI